MPLARLCERLKSFGINMVYTHNYGCEPGSHLSYAEMLRAADDVGMLVSFTQPHFSHYNWKAPDADRTNGYAAARRVLCPGRAQSSLGRLLLDEPQRHRLRRRHESALDRRPALTRGHPGRKNNTKLALRAEAIVRRLDPGRIVYHHASGNLGSMHASNFYPNFAPVQELSDWFEHWATEGVKPVFTCEYGAPFTWDWSMYRGWYKGERSFGRRQVPWELCFAEWNAQFLGDRAYRVDRDGKSQPALGGQAVQGRQSSGIGGITPTRSALALFDDRHEVIGMYLSDNFRAFRTWGVSATSPWEFGHFWRPRAGVDKRRRELKVDWNEPPASRLQPGLYRPAIRPHGHGVRAIGLDSDRRRPGPDPQQPPVARLPRRQASADSRARTITSSPAKPSKSSSSS